MGYYTSFSQEVEQYKIEAYAIQRTEILKQYKQFGGFKTIQQMMDLADPNDFKNVFNIVKKYSLVREYQRNGFPADAILSYKDFNSLTPNDVYRIMRAKADNINSVINALDDPVVLNDNMLSLVDGFLRSPRFGIKCPWESYNRYFRGLLPGNVLIQAFKSNDGKSRNLTFLAAYVCLVQKQKFMMLSNEMTEVAIRSCLLCTVISNEVFQELHGVHITKTEEELTMGWYHSDENPDAYVQRCTDEEGNYIESEEDYIVRVKQTSEYQAVKQVAEWMEREMEGRFYFRDITADYRDSAIETELRKAKVVYQCTSFAYDTAKAYGQDDWKVLKATVTSITELAKELNMAGVCTFQLSDDSENVSIFDFNSMQLAGSKQVRHVVDCMTLGRKLKPEEYHECQYIPYSIDEVWGQAVALNLDPKKQYFAIKIDKNRMSKKGDIILFEIDLDRNIWQDIGSLVKKS